LIAAIATFALKADAWFRRGLLRMLSPDSRANLARCQAEAPLIALCRLPKPALSSPRQSNAANYGNAPYAARREVYSLDFWACAVFMRPIHCRAHPARVAAFGVGSATCSSRKRCSAAPCPCLVDWIPGGKFHCRTELALSDLRKDLAARCCPSPP